MLATDSTPQVYVGFLLYEQEIRAVAVLHSFVEISALIGTQDCGITCGERLTSRINICTNFVINPVFLACRLAVTIRREDDTMVILIALDLHGLQYPNCDFSQR